MGRHSSIDADRGKHFPVRRYPTKKRCAVCGYKKMSKKNKSGRKQTNSVKNVTCPSAKRALKCFIQRVKCNIHIYST